MTNTQYPITITEIPHWGAKKTWVLYDEKHLNEVIAQAENSGYSDWHTQEGNIAFEEDADGELIEIRNEANTLDAYLDWLRSDLSQLIVDYATDTAVKK